MFRLGDRVIVRDTGLKGKILNMQSIGYWKDDYCYSMCTVLLDNNLGLTKVPEYGLLPYRTNDQKSLMMSYIDNDQKSLMMSYIDKVVFNEPATIVLWKDGTKTVVKCGKGDIFDPEKGLAMAIAKKALGNKGYYYEVFKKFIPEDKPVSSKFIVGDRVVFDCLGDIHLGIIKEIELSRDRFVYIVECMDQNGTTLTVRIDEGDLSYAPV